MTSKALYLCIVYGLVNILYCMLKITIYRYDKSFVNQQPGWNTEAIERCQKEDEGKSLKPEDYWGGLVVDEWKIQA